MKRFLVPLLSLVLMAVSCGPSRHAIHIEMRYPSKSGLDLAGKAISVVYLENDDEQGNMFNESMADAFAYNLEKDYGTGEGSVGIYRMRSEDSVEYADRDHMLDLLVDTDADVVFLFDTLKFGPVLSDGTTQFSMALYCFDGMDKGDQVHTYKGTSAAIIAEGGAKSGTTVSSSFKSQWRNEQYSLMYFNNERWYKALDRAEAYDWKGAMDMWMTLLSSNDPLRRSCAAYNIATACYMLADYELAAEWLDYSDKENKLTNSDNLRKRINERRAY
jgi:hypothetical protein